MNRELIEAELDESVKKYKVTYLLDKVLKKEINQYLIEKLKDNRNKYFYMIYPFFEKENYQNGAYQLNYEYNHLLEGDLYFYLPLTKHSTFKCFLLEKQDNYDDLFDEILKNIHIYKEKIIKSLNDYILKVDNLLIELKGLDISLFNSNFSTILNKEIPNDYKIIEAYIQNNKLCVKILNKQSLTLNYLPLTTIDVETSKEQILKMIQNKLKNGYLHIIVGLIRKEYFNHELYNNLKLTFYDNDKQGVFDVKDYSFKINITSSLEEFKKDVLNAESTIWLKKRLKKKYYQLLKKENIFEKRITRIKFINFIDNFIKKIQFTNDNTLENGRTIFLTNKIYNLDELSSSILEDAKTNIK